MTLNDSANRRAAYALGLEGMIIPSNTKLKEIIEEDADLVERLNDYPETVGPLKREDKFFLLDCLARYYVADKSVWSWPDNKNSTDISKIASNMIRDGWRFASS